MKIKKESKDVIGTMYQRPLPEALVNYCAIDVMDPSLYVVRMVLVFEGRSHGVHKYLLSKARK